jgi:hypothetical protein
MNASTAAPVRKVWSGALGGAATTLIIWLVSTFAHTNIPDPVAAALTVLVTFAVAYLVPNAASDYGVTG